MSTAQSAQSILNDLVVFGWPLIAGFALLMALPAINRGGDTPSENLVAAVWITGLLSLFVGFSFLNVDGADIVRVMSARPAWGSYTGAVFLITIAASGYISIRRLRTSRTKYSIIEAIDTGTPPPLGSFRVFLIIGVLWLAAIAIDVLWLEQIAK